MGRRERNDRLLERMQRMGNRAALREPLDQGMLDERKRLFALDAKLEGVLWKDEVGARWIVDSG